MGILFGGIGKRAECEGAEEGITVVEEALLQGGCEAQLFAVRKVER